MIPTTHCAKCGWSGPIFDCRWVDRAAITYRFYIPDDPQNADELVVDCSTQRIHDSDSSSLECPNCYADIAIPGSVDFLWE